MHSFILCILCIFYLSGCQKNVSTPSFDEDVTIIATESVTPTIKPIFEPTPSIKPSASVSSGDELTTQSAQTIIEEQVDPQKYTVSLLTEDLLIDSTHYIAFLAYEKNIPLEPVLLVNKVNGTISSLTFDGKVSGFNLYSLTCRQQSQDTIDYDWNGRFYCKDNGGRVIGTLQIIQNDPYSFEFFINSSTDFNSKTIAGVGHIIGNNAFFSDESDHYLSFTMNEDTISVCDLEETSSATKLCVNGDYIFQDYDSTDKYSISASNAVNLLQTLSTVQTKLPAPLSDYSLKTQDIRTIVKDRICYVIDAFAQLDSNDILMTTFYVSIDGSVIFAFDNTAEDPYSVILMK